MALYAHLALQNHNILPDDFMLMSKKQRAFLVASDMIAAERMKDQMKK